jgi:hypothetical protein
MWHVSVGFTLGDATFTGLNLGTTLGDGACLGLTLGEGYRARRGYWLGVDRAGGALLGEPNMGTWTRGSVFLNCDEA